MDSRFSTTGSRHHHWLYVWIPIFGSVVWFGTLLAMLVTWLAQGRPHYVSMEGNIAYISDVGADILKPLFITGCSITALSFFLTLVVEKGLRHTGRLVPNFRNRERVCAFLAILGSFIGGCGLILLSIFDTKRFPSLHRVFLLVFMLGVALSALFTIMELRFIAHDVPWLRTLRVHYIVKGIIAGAEILLAIAFAIFLFLDGTVAYDVAAILEWVIAFGFTFYLLSFAWDLRMSKGVGKGEARLLALQGADVGEHNGGMRQI
ncbi:hypothetical protein BT69DRAFT_1213734 [Atractiella rhizophila]|nr:hypothetical protein BT69DRAFT_1213734 [Atractiella rhizophila]